MGHQAEEGDLQDLASLWDSKASRQFPEGQAIGTKEFGWSIAQTQMWEKFDEAMKQDFQLAPKMFWLTFLPKRGKPNPVHTVFRVRGD